MHELATVFLTIGLILLAGFVVDFVGARTRLPRVTLLLVFGMLIGPSGLDVLPTMSHNWYPFLSHLALAMIGFLLGEKLSLANMRRVGKQVIAISLCVVVASFALVTVGLYLIGVSISLALVFGAIAAATAPASTIDLIQQYGIKNDFSDTVLGVVAIDDVWGIILFGLVIVFVSLNGDAASATVASSLTSSVWELFGALLVGCLLGLVMAGLTGRFRPGETLMMEVLVFMFIATGVAMMLEVSYLLTAVTMGAVVANVAKHHERPFHAIQDIERPILVLFFVLAGASFQLSTLTAMGWIGAMYILMRVAGRWSGVQGALLLLGTRDWRYGHWMSMTLLQQAGVPIGLALVVSQKFPSIGTQVLTVVIATTIVFELAGPLLARHALSKSASNSMS